MQSHPSAWPRKMLPVPSYDTASDLTSHPPIIRGRRRRRARREGQSIQQLTQQAIQQAIHDGLGDLRGRSRRSYKRRAQFACNDDSTPMSHLSLQPPLPTTTSLFEELDRSTMAGSPTGHESMPITPIISYDFIPKDVIETRHFKISDDGSLPVCLLEASSKQPVYFRRLSAHLKPSSASHVFNIDKSVVIAIEKVGENYRNELLEWFLDSTGYTSVTVAAIMEILTWVSLPMLKMLQKSSLPVSSAQLLFGSIPNEEHGLEVFDYLTNEDAHVYMNDELFNHVLVFAFNAVRKYPIRSPPTLEREMKDNYYVQLCKLALTKFPEMRTFATTVACAVAAEGKFVSGDFIPLGWEFISQVLNKCYDLQDVSGLLELALERCSISTMRLLLDNWPTQTLSKAAMLGFFRRYDRHFLETLYDPPKAWQQDFEEMLSHFGTRLSTLPSLETLFTSLHTKHNGSAILHRLRVVDANLKITSLMARTALSCLQLGNHLEYLEPNEISYSAENLLAAMEVDNESRRKRDVQIIKYMLSRSSAGEITTKVVTAAALAMPAGVFKAFLDHNTHTIVDSSALMAAMRSRHPALPKVRLILDRATFEYETLDTNFWVSFINNNHHQTPAVFDLLQSRLRIPTSNALIVAAWRTNSAKNLIKRLLKDKSFKLSATTISAIMLEDEDEDDDDSKPELFKWLLDKINNLFIDGDLIADSFCHMSYLQILLRKHGNPRMLYVSATKLRGILYEFIQNENELASYDKLYAARKSIIHYVMAGGGLAPSRRVLKMLWLHDVKLMLKVWKAETTIQALDLVLFAVKLELDADHMYQVLDVLVGEILDKIDKTTIDTLSSWKSTSSLAGWPCRSFWALLLRFIYFGELSKFQRLYSLLEDTHFPSSEVERLFALLVVRPGDERFHTYSQMVNCPKFADILVFIKNLFPQVTLGSDFFQAIREMDSVKRASEHVSGTTVLEAWGTLLGCSITIEWTIESQEAIFQKHSAEVVIKIMTTIGDDFIPCEQLALAAINSEEALPKVELLWQKCPEMIITQPMIEAAVRSTSVETLDFLVARSEPLKVTEEFITIALENVKSVEDPVHPYRLPITVGESMVELLMAHETTSELSHSTIEMAVRRLNLKLAQKFLSHTRSGGTNGEIILAMLDQRWPAQRILQEVKRGSNDVELFSDPDIIATACKSDQGRALLSLMNIDKHHHSAIQAALLAEAPLKSTSGNWLILDHLSSAPQIHLNDHELAHLWHECNVSNSNSCSKQPLFYLLEHGATGRIGPKTFGSFHQTCISSTYRRHRVSGNLPNLPAEITEEVIKVAKDGVTGRMAFDYLLGPDHEVIVHESALQACARLGEEIWLARLLQKMSPEQLVAVDKESLLKEAKLGAKKSIVEICSILAGRPVVKKNAWRRILQRERYLVAQRRRVGRPKVLNVWRQGFKNFVWSAKIKRLRVQRRLTE